MIQIKILFLWQDNKTKEISCCSHQRELWDLPSKITIQPQTDNYSYSCKYMSHLLMYYSHTQTRLEIKLYSWSWAALEDILYIFVLIE